MVGRSTQGLPVQLYLHLSPRSPPKPIYELGHKTGWVIIRQQLIQGWWE